jgi:opine dehydrogenase
MAMNVAVLGGGNGAFAAAGDLALRGHRVAMCEVPEFFPGLQAAAVQGTLRVEALPTTGLPSGLARLGLVTDDVEAAVSRAEVVLVVVPSYALTRFADFIAPALRPHHTLLIMPGNLWGAYRVATRLRAAGVSEEVLIGEAECLIYAARKADGTSVVIRGYKKHLGVAAVEADRAEELRRRLLPLYADLRRLDSVLQSGLSNVNPFFHPAILLGNLGLADAPQPRRFYAEGVSGAVARLIEHLDGERLATAAALGITLPRLRELLLLWYAHEGAAGTSLHAVIHSNPAYRDSLFPAALATTRYLMEDIPFGLVPFVQLAKRVGVPTPLAAAIVAFGEQAAASMGAELPAPDVVDLASFLQMAVGHGGHGDAQWQSA